MNDIATPPALKLSRRDKFSLALLHFFGRRSLRLLQALGSGIGWLASLFRSTGYYSVVNRNLELCFPEKDEAWRKTTTRECLVHTATTAMEFAKTWGMPTPYSLAQIKAVHNEHLFHQALAAGRGTLGIIPHFGSWEFMNAWVNQYCAPIIMYKPNKSKAVDAFVLEARGRLQATMVATDDRGVKALLKGIKKNGFAAILPDHVPHENGGIYAPFFGISTWTGVIVPKLIGRTNCSVIMMYCLRRELGDGFEIFFDEADSDIHNPDIAIATAAMNHSVETMIRRHPGQYQWTYKRFKQNENGKYPYR
jgi:KDO2-lipid IV(A) lauroyltransferase